jgi:hypothetical protein
LLNETRDRQASFNLSVSVAKDTEMNCSTSWVLTFWSLSRVCLNQQFFRSVDGAAVAVPTRLTNEKDDD